MGGKRVVAIAAAVAATAVVAIAWGMLGAPRVAEPVRPAPPSPDFPGGRPIDAAAIASGRLAMERMPEEVSSALELHSAEIERTAGELAQKQARVSGTCAPGSAIRVVGEDGSVLCQRLPRGVASAAALGGVPRLSTTGTAQGSVPGGVGRYQTSGEDDFLVVPISLPDGVVVTGFSFVFWDADPRVDGAAYLYRSDDTVLAAVVTDGAREEVRLVETAAVQSKRVDDAAFGYFVYMQTSAAAGANLMPIAASVTFRYP